MNKRFVLEESGATAIEYGLIAALLALVLVAALASIGTSLSGFFDDAKIKIETSKTP